MILSPPEAQQVNPLHRNRRALLVLSVLAPAMASAQQSSTLSAFAAHSSMIDHRSDAQVASVTGRVTDARSGQPLAAAPVTVVGTQQAAVTGQDGVFHIVGVAAGIHTISARRIGYAPVSRVVTLVDGGSASVDFALQPSAVDLAQVIVTGTAGTQTRAAQGAVVATIDALDITAKAPVSTLTEVLQGRVAGVNVASASGTLGAAPRISIRGATSISLSNAPLVFIDGIRVASGARMDIGGYHGLSGLGGQSVTAMNDINPDDIESVEIVKGPAAATLYGADASAGVIQIITRKGRLGSKRFNQSITTEYNQVQPNFTPLALYGTCGATDVVAGGADLCQGKTAGAVISDNVLLREGVFRNGNLQALEYSGQGGGDNFGYFVSASANNELGTQPGNHYIRRTGRTSFDWTVDPRLSVNASVGMSRNEYRVPMGDDSNYAYLIQAGFLGSPFNVAVGADGTRTGGTSTPVAGLSAIVNELTTVRFTPSAQIRYAPLPWLTNRLTVGADVASTHGFTMFPKNADNWYSGDQANGYVEDTQHPIHIYTVDYLGNIRKTFGREGWLASDLSFGSQYINTVENYLSGVGIGLASNSSYLVSSASTNESHQEYSQSKSLGLLAQEQLSFGEKLYLQAGARVDQNSAFGQAFGSLFLPKVSASYVLSQEPYWQRVAPMVSTLRLRAAYGTTGRSPSPGASLRTYVPFPFVTSAGGVLPGVIQASPGNPNLKPERGTEFETGFDAGFFGGRAGVELTYFAKRTSDLLLRNPLAPSLAFTSNPFVNAGTVDNRGLEFTVRATPIDRKNIALETTLTGSTVKNKLVSLGSVAISPVTEISPDLTYRYVPGQPLAAWYSSKVLSVDTVGGFATVTDAPVYAGQQFPTSQVNLSSTITLFRNLRVFGLFTSQRGGKLLNVTPLVQDLFFNSSAETNLPAGQGGYSKAEQLARFGPFKTADGKSVSTVIDSYLQSTDFVRLQELSATLTVPDAWARNMRATSASLTVGGRNLHLWKDKGFQGYDPAVISNTVNGGAGQYATAEEFTVPQPRLWLVRLNLQF
ncbi:MAG: SusC/RagA family TonB-linked outer membrane protein [bacterium]